MAYVATNFIHQLFWDEESKSFIASPDYYYCQGNVEIKNLQSSNTLSMKYVRFPMPVQSEDTYYQSEHDTGKCFVFNPSRAVWTSVADEIGVSEDTYSKIYEGSTGVYNYPSEIDNYRVVTKEEITSLGIINSFNLVDVDVPFYDSNTLTASGNHFIYFSEYTKAWVYVKWSLSSGYNIRVDTYFYYVPKDDNKLVKFGTLNNMFARYHELTPSGEGSYDDTKIKSDISQIQTDLAVANESIAMDRGDINALQSHRHNDLKKIADAVNGVDVTAELRDADPNCTWTYDVVIPEFVRDDYSRIDVLYTPTRRYTTKWANTTATTSVYGVLTIYPEILYSTQGKTSIVTKMWGNNNTVLYSTVFLYYGDSDTADDFEICLDLCDDTNTYIDTANGRIAASTARLAANEPLLSVEGVIVYPKLAI